MQHDVPVTSSSLRPRKHGTQLSHTRQAGKAEARFEGR